MKTLTLVIPVYNESKRLNKTFSTLNKWIVSSGLKLEQVIFVNDGSTDQSLKILKSTALKLNKKIISYPKNMGKGFAIKKGMLASKADYTLMLDADMATTPTQIKRFLPLIKGNINVIIGTRKTATLPLPFTSLL